VELPDSAEDVSKVAGFTPKIKKEDEKNILLPGFSGNAQRRIVGAVFTGKERVQFAERPAHAVAHAVGFQVQ